MNLTLKEKLRESLSSVLPITAIILALGCALLPIPIGTLLLFLAGALLLILGMGLFSLGADMAMMPMGEALGDRLTRTKSLPLVAAGFFLMGVIVTVAEPDLAVLARQVPAIPDLTLILTVAVGVGLFLVAAMLRTLFRLKLRYLLLAFYALVFGVSFFAPDTFLAVAFDSGGVTTGPITVPFIMALGIGMASARGDDSSQEDSFGMVALSSVGPILAVLLLGICYDPSSASYEAVTVPEVETSLDLARAFAQGFPHYAQEVFLALLPIGAVCLLFQLATRAFGRRQLIKIGVGLLYTVLGLILFLTGVNVGFLPAGYFIGAEVAGSPHSEIARALGLVMGWFIVAAEPAVHVLNRQVEEVTSGAISQKAMSLSLSAGGGPLRRPLHGPDPLADPPLLYPGAGGISWPWGWPSRPPPIFTGIAFDSGGVASGPMTSHLPPPLRHGGLRGGGRGDAHGRLRPGGPGGHDPPGDHPAPGALVPGQDRPFRRPRRRGRDHLLRPEGGARMDPGKLMLLVTIVERPRGEEAARLCAGAGLHYHLGALGKGTASGEMLDLLGLGERDKAVILSLIPAARSRELREYLCRELQLRYPGRGILFTLPLSGINARAAAGLAAMAPQEKGAEPMEQQERRPLWEYHLILASGAPGLRRPGYGGRPGGGGLRRHPSPHPPGREP